MVKIIVQYQYNYRLVKKLSDVDFQEWP